MAKCARHQPITEGYLRLRWRGATHPADRDEQRHDHHHELYPGDRGDRDDGQHDYHHKILYRRIGASGVSERQLDVPGARRAGQHQRGSRHIGQCAGRATIRPLWWRALFRRQHAGQPRLHRAGAGCIGAGILQRAVL